MVEGRGEEGRGGEGGSNLGNRPGKSTRVHKFTIGPAGHHLSPTHTHTHKH